MGTTSAGIDEDRRAHELIAAEEKAVRLFDEVLRRGLVAPGKGEKQVSDEVRDLGAELFGTDKHWHKRVVRAGGNTLQPYTENPPDRVITEDDIVFLDFGPIFSDWEADVGRTYVLGDDPVKHRLREDLDAVWAAGRDHFEAHPDITGAELYAHVCELARARGWTFGGPHSGHLVGEFPHELIDDERRHSYITEGNDQPMRTVDPSGRTAHWILEVHLVDAERGFGGFTEQLLSLRR
ncbi:aminopeptidase [Actinomycetospora sp. NBRC 106375]|uniref:M24 family metallopeptidase n=1 Tax=Actinomycetospora sp. NBRC 106375 TaxID=3032207 RepID=UPI00249FAC61|nr:M24 family metallopeptidase [Actinomycetospora sp. NBRC 106375]GLZ47689.1 aminopeptidase [Actinomycetospora sp. NBRC 106375]